MGLIAAVREWVLPSIPPHDMDIPLLDENFDDATEAILTGAVDPHRGFRPRLVGGDAG